MASRRYVVDKKREARRSILGHGAPRPTYGRAERQRLAQHARGAKKTLRMFSHGQPAGLWETCADGWKLQSMSGPEKHSSFRA